MQKGEMNMIGELIERQSALSEAYRFKAQSLQAGRWRLRICRRLRERLPAKEAIHLICREPVGSGVFYGTITNQYSQLTGYSYHRIHYMRRFQSRPPEVVHENNRRPY